MPFFGGLFISRVRRVWRVVDEKETRVFPKETKEAESGVKWG